jgi:hypothetical protein
MLPLDINFYTLHTIQPDMGPRLGLLVRTAMLDECQACQLGFVLTF